MEGSSIMKKRKITCHEEHGNNHTDEELEKQDEDEEKKMEEFFALIRSIREARNHILMQKQKIAKNNDNSERKRRVVDGNEKPKAVWNPSFQREDFMENIQFRSSPPMASSSHHIKEASNGLNQEIKDGLDLKLSL
ncbi:hypothetical protein HYC85_024764 [Camellia sinensis]|uniref:Uncharacterized protein n=1 Tax=Camellia sinensis TaxID=4442 RepID=A0A7J7GCX4_CAMSI|nr:hypothetical protein HYC85_024764 [Camellia sinensis]